MPNAKPKVEVCLEKLPELKHMRSKKCEPLPVASRVDVPSKTIHNTGALWAIYIKKEKLLL